MRQAVFAIVLVAAPFAAFAQNAPQSDDRFQIERQGANTFIRLDRKSGAISTCTFEAGNLDCRAGQDERAALQDEIDRLANEVDRLKEQTASAEPKTGIDKGGKEITLKLPSEEEIKGVMSYLEDMFRRLVDKVRDLTLTKDA